MSKVIQFVDQVVKYRGEEARRRMMLRNMNRWYLKNRQKMQEAAEERKRQERHY